jgi:hypothetical protein
MKIFNYIFKIPDEYYPKAERHNTHFSMQQTPLIKVVEMLCCPVITNSVCFSLQVYLRD